MITTDQQRQLRVMFRDLRGRNLIARQRFSCCRSCAEEGLLSDFRLPRNRSKVGAVYYTRQDADCLKDNFVYVGFGTLKVPVEDSAIILVGLEVMEAARAAGIKAEWNGEANRRIRLSFEADV